MTARKRPVKQEPLLNTVARSLGHAAGKLTRVTQELTENLSTLPEAVTTKLRGGANAGTPAEASARPPKKRTRNASRARTAKKTTPTAKRGSSAKKKSPRRKSQRAGA